MAVVRAVLVDAGGVLFNNVSEDSDFIRCLSDRYGVDQRRLLQEIDRRDAEYETDARHVHDVLADCLAAAGARPGFALDKAEVDHIYLCNVRAHPSSFAALRRVRTARPGTRLALANNEAAHWDLLKDRRYRHFTLFDVIGSSWRLGQVKPAAEYFHRLLDACACEPHEALFLDDNPLAVDAAVALGLHARLLASPDDLIPALHRIDGGQS